MPVPSPSTSRLDDDDKEPLTTTRYSLDSNFSDLSRTSSEVLDPDPLANGKEGGYRDFPARKESLYKHANETFSGGEKARLVWGDGDAREKEARGKVWWRSWTTRGWRLYITVLLVIVSALIFLFPRPSPQAPLAEFPATSEGKDYTHSEPYYPTPRGGSLPSWSTAYSKASALVAQMTLVEKVNLTTGTGWSMGMCVGNTAPLPRLKFPSLCLQDGPLGLRFVDNATAWPAGVTVGATWSKDLMYRRGEAHAHEARAKGVNILLGPAMGPLGRLPAGGRNWEGFGADPVLQGIGAAETIKGIQSTGVMATAKHFAGNEQEHFRQAGEWGTTEAFSSNIDDRTLHEIYAWPFAEAVKAGVAGVMCAYNQVNNSYACQNSKLLNGILKSELGFQGFVMSDWLAHRSGVASALAGLDMTMPGDGLHWQDGRSLWGSELTASVLNGSVPMSRLNDMVLRITAAWYQLGQNNATAFPSSGPNFSSWTNEKIGNLYPGSPDSEDEGVVNKFLPVRTTTPSENHDALAREIAIEGTVLVKNVNNILPLPLDGKGWTPKSGLSKLKIGVFGEDAFVNPDGINSCEDRGCNKGTLAMGWGSGAVELPYLSSPHFALGVKMFGDHYSLSLWPDNLATGVEQVAGEQDICLVFINSDSGEGYLSWEDIRGDRNDLYAQKGGDELVARVAAVCESTIVVMHTVGPTILERWIDLPGVKAVLIAHLPGQESGNAIADIIFGDAEPSGRLPYTIAKAEEDYGPTSKVLYYPNSPTSPQQNFSEGVFIDYRYFDREGIEPRYAFGYGLGYTNFSLANLRVNQLQTISELEPLPPPAALEPRKLPRESTQIPDPETALWPEGMRRLKKFIYPYLTSLPDKTSGTYPYPHGYSTSPHEPSRAGGGEGGNPDLWTPLFEVSAGVQNVGARDGKAVVQVYVSFPNDATDSLGKAVEFPVRVLRQFEKVWLAAPRAESEGKAESEGQAGSEGQGRAEEPKKSKKEVTLQLTRRDLSFWDVGRQNWVLPEGRFEVCLGFSSQDLRVCQEVEVRMLEVGFGDSLAFEGLGGEMDEMG